MRTYHSNEIGNVVVLGHSGSGKTSVIEAMAYRAGITNRIGTIEDGNTLSDYSAEEVKRQTSIGLTAVSYTHLFSLNRILTFKKNQIMM